MSDHDTISRLRADLAAVRAERGGLKSALTMAIGKSATAIVIEELRRRPRGRGGGDVKDGPECDCGICSWCNGQRNPDGSMRVRRHPASMVSAEEFALVRAEAARLRVELEWASREMENEKSAAIAVETLCLGLRADLFAERARADKAERERDEAREQLRHEREGGDAFDRELTHARAEVARLREALEAFAAWPCPARDTPGLVRALGCPDLCVSCHASAALEALT